MSSALTSQTLDNFPSQCTCDLLLELVTPDLKNAREDFKVELKWFCELPDGCSPPFPSYFI